MAVLNLTEARVRDLPLGSGIHRDEQVKGLMVVCHRTTRTYAVQGDVRRNGRHVRTVRVKIDRCDRIGLREARSRAKGLMSRIQSGVDPTAGPEETGVTLAQVMDRYADGRDLSPRTVGGYRYNLDHYLRGLRNRAVADVTRAEVRELYDAIRRRSGETAAASAMRTLRLLVNEARRMDETIGDNPVSALRVPQTRRREVGEIDLKEWWARTGALPPIRRDAHRMFMFSGLRRESLLTVRRDDVDFDLGLVAVRHMKSRRPFILPLSDFMTELLWHRMADDERVGSEWLWPSPTSRSGRVVEPREEGLPSPHAYRHHWRTQSIAAGVPYAESALLLDQRLPGASGGYVHQSHLAEHLRAYQERVTGRLLSMVDAAG
jgi:integrase